MIASGSSVRGLSLVTQTRSAPSSAIRAMSGRLLRSRSPPQPKTRRMRGAAGPDRPAIDFPAHRDVGVIDEATAPESRGHACNASGGRPPFAHGGGGPPPRGVRGHNPRRWPPEDYRFEKRPTRASGPMHRCPRKVTVKAVPRGRRVYPGGHKNLRNTRDLRRSARPWRRCWPPLDRRRDPWR